MHCSIPALWAIPHQIRQWNCSPATQTTSVYSLCHMHLCRCTSGALVPADSSEKVRASPIMLSCSCFHVWAHTPGMGCLQLCPGDYKGSLVHISLYSLFATSPFPYLIVDSHFPLLKFLVHVPSLQVAHPVGWDTFALTWVGGCYLLPVVLDLQKESRGHKIQISAININCATICWQAGSVCSSWGCREWGRGSRRKGIWLPVPMTLIPKAMYSWLISARHPLAISISTRVEELQY